MYPLCCYSIGMKTSQTYLRYAVKRIIFITLIVIVCAYLQGCAVYTVASATSLVTTQKSIGDHVLSNTIPNADCSLRNVIRDKYYCEVRDVAKTYNRNGI